MIDTIMIENHPVEINTSAGWLYCYREQFGHDIMVDLYPLMSSVTSVATELLGDIVKEKGDDSEEIRLSEVLKHIDGDVVQEMLVKLSAMEMTTILNILWAMAKNATPNIEKPQRFINQFDVMPIEQIIPELFKRIVKSSASSKNSQSLLEKLSKMKNLSISIR